jgi:hypothetical protein
MTIRVLYSTVLTVLALSISRPVFAQQSVNNTLSFLLTNRSIATNNPSADAAAAAATRDTMSRFLLLELSTLPTVSSSTGFTYRMDRNLGGVVSRSSESFGPVFVERSLTAGSLRPSFGMSFQEMRFSRIDGRSLGDGTLVATAGRLTGEAEPFDVETVAMHLRTRTLTLSTNVGLIDRVDVSASLPLVLLTLDGQRIDTLRGVSSVQATARVDASGVGDLVLEAKYNAISRGATGVAVGIETRVPTGAEENLLGAGEASLKPRLIGSLERGRVSVHGELGYVFGGLSREFDYAGAVEVVGNSRMTFVGELLGRRLESGGRIVETVAPHPTLAGVETIRLTGVPEATYRALAVGSVKWNLAQTWLLSASVMRSLTSTGLTAKIIPSLVVEYSFGR